MNFSAIAFEQKTHTCQDGVGQIEISALPLLNQAIDFKNYG